MGRNKIHRSTAWYRIVHILGESNEEFTWRDVMRLWSEISPRTAPTKGQIATVLRSQPMVYVIEQQNRGTCKLNTYGICQQWIEENPMSKIMEKYHNKTL